MYFYPRPPRGGRRPWGPAAFRSSRFLSTPSARRATRPRQYLPPRSPYFYPRPPRGGRPRLPISLYLSMVISIHALREEGDCCGISWSATGSDFYPRPPRGGRQGPLFHPQCPQRFLSTPSARRATSTKGIPAAAFRFLSTPSARRATPAAITLAQFIIISIHALREEGDRLLARLSVLLRTISIHALREEGDQLGAEVKRELDDFYPRPPRGGRPQPNEPNPPDGVFLSTPSARRATAPEMLF